MALSFGSVISFSYICIVNEKDGLLRRESRLQPGLYTIVDTHKKTPFGVSLFKVALANVVPCASRFSQGTCQPFRCHRKSV